jgi:hypothetical protein
MRKPKTSYERVYETFTLAQSLGWEGRMPDPLINTPEANRLLSEAEDYIQHEAEQDVEDARYFGVEEDRLS